MDYVTVENIFAYGGVEAPTPTETEIMAQRATAVSRAIDQYCNMVFEQQTVSTTQIARIDTYGNLSVTLPTPMISAVSAIATRMPGVGSLAWSAGDLGRVETQNVVSGSVLRYYPTTLDFAGARNLGWDVSLQVTYTGGWSDIAQIPADLSFAALKLCWFDTKRRDAPVERTAIPELGIIVIPQSWPKDVTEALRNYRYWATL